MYCSEQFWCMRRLDFGSWIWFLQKKLLSGIRIKIISSVPFQSRFLIQSLQRFLFTFPLRFNPRFLPVWFPRLQLFPQASMITPPVDSRAKQEQHTSVSNPNPQSESSPQFRESKGLEKMILSARFVMPYTEKYIFFLGKFQNSHTFYENYI